METFLVAPQGAKWAFASAMKINIFGKKNKTMKKTISIVPNTLALSRSRARATSLSLLSLSLSLSLKNQNCLVAPGSELGLGLGDEGFSTLL